MPAGGRPRRVAIRGIGGSLAASDVIEAIADGSARRDPLRSCLDEARRQLGPASGARQIFDTLIAPLLREVALTSSIAVDSQTCVGGVLIDDAGRVPLAAIGVCGWGGDLRRLREATGRLPSAGEPRWWIGCNGPTLRIVDASRAYSRRALDVELEAAADDVRVAAVLRHLLGDRSHGRLAGLESAVDASDRHRIAVGESLQQGVETALTLLVGAIGGRRRQHTTPDAALAEALTVVYRILFLLFAEARELVPGWHPVYRASYTIESLRPAAEGRRTPAGLWQSLQAITRLAHRGCRAGTLTVVPFNGRLFAPSAAPAADTIALDDRVARDVLLAITTRPGRDRRDRISYADLGVEQLGAVYERVLDYSPVVDRNTARLVSNGRRKSTGTFYTPRSITEYLVRRTLAPLVRGRSSEQILQLRIVDPAMGSGAFLVGACRYLAGAYEAALVKEGSTAAADSSAAERATFRRIVAQRCLYGVDLNPTAVQLARLSLWLCTLAADRPLTFLDHHLRRGNSLAGASAVDVARQAPGEPAGRSPLPLFEADELTGAISAIVGPRLAVAGEPDDSAEVVRRKERTIERLSGSEGPLARGRASADAWCSAWFWPTNIDRPPRVAWPALARAANGADSDLPRSFARLWTAAVLDVGRRERFFHWEMEFPEVFFDEDGHRRPDGGFDAVLGNPPWETLRGDAGSAEEKSEARRAARALTRFSRESGCFRFQSGGHANLYQLFTERMLQLAAPGGRVGILTPSGLFSDHGCAELRRHLLGRMNVDSLIMFDNREAVFPIHRSVRFAVFTATKGPAARELRTRAGVRDPAALDDVPDEGDVPGHVAIPLTLINRFSRDDLAVPDLRTDADRALLAHVVSTIPPLADPRGWNARVGRELNATDDRRYFSASGLPVLEGKAIDPFRVNVAAAAAFIDPSTLARVFGARVTAARARLGYREVAASTNALTLIAAMIPARVVTTHTIFCVKQPDDPEVHLFLCGIFNSYVANWLVRLRGSTHVPASLIHELPVPAPAATDPLFLEIRDLAKAAPNDRAGRANLQAAVAELYRLSPEQFSHLLGTFPLVPERDRDAALECLLDRSHTV
jgi:hypothetical protein